MGVYENKLREAIHLFKYYRNSLLALPLGFLLAKHGSGILTTHDYDIIFPVPLHPRRLRQRGFNQALMLARQVGKIWGIEVDFGRLQRIRPTYPQTALKEKERMRNVKGAFMYTGKNLHQKTILLIDDVYTSGSTVNECAKVLKKNGALRIDVLTLARTI
jgi:ComF family protein